MTGGMSPEQYGEMSSAHLVGAITIAAIALALVVAGMFALEAIARRQERRRAPQQSATTAEQLDAGTQAGWHDASPADRRRDR